MNVDIIMYECLTCGWEGSENEVDSTPIGSALTLSSGLPQWKTKRVCPLCESEDLKGQKVAF